METLTENYNASITVPVTATDVLKKISEITNWWGVTFSGNAEKQNDTFEIKMSGDSYFKMTVAELTPGKKLVWLVTDCHMPWFTDKTEWTNTKLIFDLSENNGATILKFTHQGLTPNVECYKDCETGWNHWIQTSLFSYLTTGQGVFRAPTK